MEKQPRLCCPLLVGLIIGLAACSESPTSPSNGGVPAASPAASPTPRGPDPIFDSSQLHEVALKLDPADWQALRTNYLENQYYAADITVDGETLRSVGIRSRGQGSRNEAKPNIKVDTNKYVPSQEFHGYKTLVLNADIQDSSILRERLAFEVFRAMGIPAPLLSHTRLTVNGEYWGVYTLVEAVTKPFLRRTLNEDGGYLFDYEWVFKYRFEFLGADPGLYIPSPFQPQTHEDDLDPAGLVNFIRAINETTDEAFVATMSGYLDVDKFLTYVAVENAIAETDGMVGEWDINNFYLYQYQDKQRFVFIPWDKDTSFQNSAWPLMLNMDRCVLTQRLMNDPAKQAVYVNAVKTAVDSYVNSGWLTPRLDAAYSQIREAMLADNKKPANNDGWEGSVGSLRNVINGRRNDVLSQLP
jgi:hypothetical protein